jgi:hypothetical protein
VNDENLPPLSEYELDELLRLAPRRLAHPLARLCRELKTLREQAGERERMHAQEVNW